MGGRGCGPYDRAASASGAGVCFHRIEYRTNGVRFICVAEVTSAHLHYADCTRDDSGVVLFQEELIRVDTEFQHEQ
jgi:hypothetical protein